MMDLAAISVRQTIDMPLTQLIDEVDENTTYIGRASLGNATTAGKALAIWQIQKISKSGTLTTIAYSNGTSLFTSIWDNRATTVSYS
jgi:hypothetical protein